MQSTLDSTHSSWGRGHGGPIWEHKTSSGLGNLLLYVRNINLSMCLTKRNTATPTAAGVAIYRSALGTYANEDGTWKSRQQALNIEVRVFGTLVNHYRVHSGP